MFYILNEIELKSSLTFDYINHGFNKKSFLILVLSYSEARSCLTIDDSTTANGLARKKKKYKFYDHCILAKKVKRVIIDEAHNFRY